MVLAQNLKTVSGPDKKELVMDLIFSIIEQIDEGDVDTEFETLRYWSRFSKVFRKFFESFLQYKQSRANERRQIQRDKKTTRNVQGKQRHVQQETRSEEYANQGLTAETFDDTQIQHHG